MPFYAMICMVDHLSVILNLRLEVDQWTEFIFIADAESPYFIWISMQIVAGYFHEINHYIRRMLVIEAKACIEKIRKIFRQSQTVCACGIISKLVEYLIRLVEVSKGQAGHGIIQGAVIKLARIMCSGCSMPAMNA